MKASIHLLPGPKTWHLSPTTNGLAFLALLLESWSSIIFRCLSCNTERMALMSISACALVVRFLPWSIAAGDGRPAPMRVVLKSAKTSWNDCVFELFESIFLTVCMCRSMKPLGRDTLVMRWCAWCLSQREIWQTPCSEMVARCLILSRPIPFNWKEID